MVWVLILDGLTKDPNHFLRHYVSTMAVCCWWCISRVGAVLYQPTNLFHCFPLECFYYGTVAWNCLYRNNVNTAMGVCEIGLFVGTMGCPLYYCTTEWPWWKRSLSVNPRANRYPFGGAGWSLYILDYCLFSFATTESWFVHSAMRKSKLKLISLHLWFYLCLLFQNRSYQQFFIVSTIATCTQIHKGLFWQTTILNYDTHKIQNARHTKYRRIENGEKIQK